LANVQRLGLPDAADFVRVPLLIVYMLVPAKAGAESEPKVPVTFPDVFDKITGESTGGKPRA